LVAPKTLAVPAPVAGSEHQRPLSVPIVSEPSSVCVFHLMASSLVWPFHYLIDEECRKIDAAKY
jgi:hypothetical protein